MTIQIRIPSKIKRSPLPVTLIGVAPPAFFGEQLTVNPPELWIPLHADRFVILEPW